MSKAEIMNKMSRNLHKFGFKFKKYSPEILAVAGVVGIVASGIMACKASTKLSGVIEETKEQLDQVHDYVEKNGFSDKYTEEDSKKDTAIIYTQTAVKLVKLYGPAVILGTLSITAMLTSNKILRKRNIALAAAYTTVDKAFKDYRGRVVERFGEELDKELKYNLKSKEIEEVVTDENGEETTVKKTVKAMNPNDISEYARFFDESCSSWNKSQFHNQMFLKQQQNYANDLLKAQGYLFLNDVYKMLGMDVAPYGQVVGWIYDEKNPVGDNFVDFGLYDLNDEAKRLFINGRERTILLDFNVDGNILDLI